MYTVTTKSPVHVEEATSIKDIVSAGVWSRATPEASLVKSPPTDINAFKEQTGGM